MKAVNWLRVLSPNFGCKFLRHIKWLIKDLKSGGVDGWLRFVGFKELAWQNNCCGDKRGKTFCFKHLYFYWNSNTFFY